jgi:hypothetical protein
MQALAAFESSAGSHWHLPSFLPYALYSWTSRTRPRHHISGPPPRAARRRLEAPQMISQLESNYQFITQARSMTIPGHASSAETRFRLICAYLMPHHSQAFFRVAMPRFTRMGNSRAMVGRSAYLKSHLNDRSARRVIVGLVNRTISSSALRNPLG